MFLVRLNKALYCSTVLALLALRVITPAGYMPAPAGSGLLFELCPDGLPVAVINSISGGNHHHHRTAGDDSESGSSNDQCPIGHMLSSSIAIDEADVLQWPPVPATYDIVSLQLLRRANRTQYFSRGPPT